MEPSIFTTVCIAPFLKQSRFNFLSQMQASLEAIFLKKNDFYDRERNLHWTLH